MSILLKTLFKGGGQVPVPANILGRRKRWERKNCLYLTKTLLTLLMGLLRLQSAMAISICTILVLTRHMHFHLLKPMIVNELKSNNHNLYIYV